MFCNVLLPINSDDTFVYSVPESLKDRVRRGSIVYADFRGKKIYGLVAGVQKESQIKNIKELSGFLFDSPVDDKYIKLIEWIAEYYFTSKGIVLRAMLPLHSGYVKRYVCTKDEGAAKKVYEKTLKKPIPEGELLKIVKDKDILKGMIENGVLVEDISAYIPPAKRNITLNEEQEAAYQIVSEQIMNSVHQVNLLMGRPSSGKSEVYIKLAHDVIDKTDGNVLIMLPEIGLAQVVFRRLQHEFGSIKCAIIHSEMSNGERLCYLKGINEGKRRIIVGTRSSIFAPVKNLRLTIIDE